jgi:hypothetical protein
VVANILSSPLKLMAPMLSGRVAPGGSLILSGVLARQAEEVAAAYAPFIKLGVWAEQDGWVALHGRSAAPPPARQIRHGARHPVPPLPHHVPGRLGPAQAPRRHRPLRRLPEHL